MPLRPGESFLEGSARVKSRKQGAKAVSSFLPSFITTPPPPKKLPPVPRAVKDWEKKSPTQKLRQAGFLGAVATDRAVTRYRYEREAARMAPALSRVPTVSPVTDPKLIARTKALEKTDRLRQAGVDPKLLAPSILEQVARGAYEGVKPIAQDYWEKATHPDQRRSTLGISTTGLPEALVTGAGKMTVGGAAGLAGDIRHPLRAPGHVMQIISDVAQPIGLALAASKEGYVLGDKGAWERMTQQLVQESYKGMVEQYGPETSWSSSIRQSYNQGLIAAINSLMVVAPEARLVAPLVGTGGKAAAIIGAGLKAGERVGVREAVREASKPLPPRTLRLRGGPEALGRDVEIPWSRSALTRGLVNRPYDLVSRRVKETTPILGKASEAQRAARATRRNLKRDVRRAHAEAANVMADIGGKNDAAQLRAFYARGVPQEWVARMGRDAAEDKWLQAQLDDVKEMLAGREVIRPSAKKTDRQLALERKVAKLQERFDEARAHRQESILQTPARAQMSAVFTEALGPERGAIAIQVADQLAIATGEPEAWYSRILTQYAEDPEASGVDLADAMLQEAGPRERLAGSPYRFDHQDAERYRENQSMVGLADGREAIITRTNEDTGQALVDILDDQGYETGEQAVVPYRDLRQAHGVHEPPVFYSQAQKIAAENLQPKMSPQQLRKALEKQGVKPAELEWTGIGDWIDAMEESGVKSLTREEVIDYLADPLNAFDLNETLWVQGDYSHRTRWGPGDYTGVALDETGGDYKELMIQLPGSQVYQSSGHMPGISNPIAQVRFHEIDGPEGRTILIDELQSDWAAAIRGNEYVTRSRDADARRAQLEQRASKRLVDLVGTLEDQLGIHYSDIPGGTNDIYYLDTYTRDLLAKVDGDWLKEHPDASASPVDPQYAAWLRTPERAALSRVRKHVVNVGRRIKEDAERAGKIARAPADMPYKKTWQQLALKRMVAYAVHEGYDSVQWTQGIVPAVRYHKIDPAEYLSPEGEGHYGTPEDHPQYPSEDDYTRSYTFHEHEFDQPDVSQDPLQQRIFGPVEEGGYVRTWLDAEAGYGPGGAPMSTTTPLRMTSEELGYEPMTQHNEFALGGHHPQVDDLVYLEEGPYANQFVRVSRANEDGTFDVVPSNIESVEFRGDGSDSGGGWQEYEVTVRENGQASYGSGSTAGDALRNANFDDLADSEWFDDIETRLDQGWESELDDYMYQEAVSDFMERWNNGEIEGTEDYEGIYAAEDIAQLDTSYVQEGNPYLYDSILPKEANKLFKKYGARVEKSTIEAAFTSEGRGTISTRGPVPTWRLDISEEMAADVMQGQSFFQAVYPISGEAPVVKGAVELMGNKRFRLTLFGQADVTTAIHELGHIALHDMDSADLDILSQQLAGGRALESWTRQDHERFARAWERYFTEGRAPTQSIRSVFRKIKQWMREVYGGVEAAGEPISPEIRAVFDRRLGKLDDGGERMPRDPDLERWGTLLSAAQGELERYQARADIARRKGTDEALRAEVKDLQGRREKAGERGDQDTFDALTEEIRQVTKELDDRDALNAARNDRREKLLRTRMGELEKALRKPDNRRYEGAQAAADFFQSEREAVLREVFGDFYDDIFLGRTAQQARWLAEHGAMEEVTGAGLGHQPYRRRGNLGRAMREAAAPVTRRFGSPRTDKLNVNKRNEMILWQQGDYQANVHVLHEEYLRALSFYYQTTLRQMLHDIGEPVDVDGPKEGYYLIDLDATPLPQEWKSARPDEIDADLKEITDALHGDDGLLTTKLQTFAESWLHKDAAKARRPDGGYKNVRQVHEKIVHQLLLPYTGSQLWNPITSGFQIANTLARASLIYTNLGYIPSNVLANAILLFAERGVFSLRDLYVGAKMVLKDKEVGRLARAEMGETHTSSYMRADRGGVLARTRGAESALARFNSAFADDWVRAAAWSGLASKNGYRTRTQQLRLLRAPDEKTRRDRNRISDQATKAMIDFDRLAPWEQRYLRPIVFVWPFMRGATAWPLEYLKEHPARAGAAVALTHGYGEQAREELGPLPDYWTSMVPIRTGEGGGASLANVSSLTPLGGFQSMMTPLVESVSSAWTGEPVGTFKSLAGLLAPQNDLLLQLLRGQDEFGSPASTRDILRAAASQFVPLQSELTLVPFFAELLDETQSAAQLDQSWHATLTRRVFRFTPQRMNLAIMNQQARSRGEKPVTSKLVEYRTKARSAWNQIAPGDHMPRIIEDSIKAYYMVQANRKLLQEEIKKSYRESWQPTRRDPKLTPLQEASIVFDVLLYQHPEMTDLDDPRTIFDRYGEQGVKTYQRNLEKLLFGGKRRADEAISRAKLVKGKAA